MNCTSGDYSYQSTQKSLVINAAVQLENGEIYFDSVTIKPKQNLLLLQINENDFDQSKFSYLYWKSSVDSSLIWPGDSIEYSWNTPGKYFLIMNVADHAGNSLKDSILIICNTPPQLDSAQMQPNQSTGAINPLNAQGTTFKWLYKDPDAKDNISIDLFLSTDSLFSDSVTTHRLFYNTNIFHYPEYLIPDTTYYWKLIITDLFGAQDSLFQTFKTHSSQVTPSYLYGFIKEPNGIPLESVAIHTILPDGSSGTFMAPQGVYAIPAITGTSLGIYAQAIHYPELTSDTIYTQLQPGVTDTLPDTLRIWTP